MDLKRKETIQKITPDIYGYQIYYCM